MPAKIAINFRLICSFHDPKVENLYWHFEHESDGTQEDINKKRIWRTEPGALRRGRISLRGSEKLKKLKFDNFINTCFRKVGEYVGLILRATFLKHSLKAC